MKTEMLINVSQPEECRIAVVENGQLEELYTERASQDNYVGNIYKGRIVNLEPSIQAAFVDFGVGRNGFGGISAFGGMRRPAFPLPLPRAWASSPLPPCSCCGGGVALAALAATADSSVALSATADDAASMP